MDMGTLLNQFGDLDVDEEDLDVVETVVDPQPETPDTLELLVDLLE